MVLLLNTPADRITIQEKATVTTGRPLVKRHPSRFQKRKTEREQPRSEATLCAGF